MSKKKFTSGLESIFGESEGGTLQESSPLLVKTKKKERRSSRGKDKPKKRSSKNFTSDLDSLFEDALRDTLQEKAEKIVKDKAKVSPARKREAPALFGLDALIRRTVEDSIDEVERKKRVTFIFDKMRLMKLKKIAKKEKSYLKDIIGEVMSKYIKEYEAEYGSIE